MRSRVALASLLCARAAGVRWSTLGVVDDGRTDNTAALNALPVGTLVEGDCPRGGVVLAQGVWMLRSNLFLRVDAGCEVLSNNTGVGSYAISQLDPTAPLNNVTLEGLAVSKTSRVPGDRILLAWIDNFRLSNWTFRNHGGAMFLRGSCQEIAGGRSFDAALEVGSPGVRHIGNIPKAACLRPLPANVWVHDNDIVCGDGVYQACQPLNNNLWANVGSDDMLFENNTGASLASAFILVGLHNKPQNSDFSCTNVTFRNSRGAGLRLIYVQAGPPPNVVEGVVLRGLELTSSDAGPYWPAAIEVAAVYGGAVRAVLMDGIRALGIPKRGLNATGVLENVVFTNGYLATPTDGVVSNVNIDGGDAVELSNSFVGGFNADNVNIGVSAATRGTRVLNCTLAGVSANRVGIAIGRADGSAIIANKFTVQPGAANTTGIATDVGAYAGTTRAAIHLNDVRALATGIVCGHGEGNNITGNPGARDC